MISPVLFRMSGLVRVKSEHQVFRASTESFPTPCPHQNNDDFPDILAYRGYIVVFLTYVSEYGSFITVSSILQPAVCSQARTCHVLGNEPDAHWRHNGHGVINSTFFLDCLVALSVLTILLWRKR